MSLLCDLPKFDKDLWDASSNGALWNEKPAFFISPEGEVEPHKIHNRRVDGESNPDRKKAIKERYWGHGGYAVANATYAAKALNDRLVHGILWTNERWWRHLKQRGRENLLKSRMPVDEQLILDIEKRYKIRLEVCRAVIEYNKPKEEKMANPEFRTVISTVKSGSQYLLNVILEVVDKDTGASAIDVLKGLHHGAEREVLVRMASDKDKSFASAEETVLPGRKFEDFKSRGNKTYISFILPKEEIRNQKLSLIVFLQEAKEPYRKHKTQWFAPSDLIPKLEKNFFFSGKGGYFVAHEDEEMFLDDGGQLEKVEDLPEFKEMSDDEKEYTKVMDEVWRKMKDFKSKDASVWKRWSAVWNLMTENHSTESLDSIKKWLELAKKKNWKPALETLPKVIKCLEGKK